MQIENNPFMDVLEHSYAIPVYGLPTGPMALPGGPRFFGANTANQGLGYFGINSKAVRLHFYNAWDDAETASYAVCEDFIGRPLDYPDTALYDEVRFNPDPFVFGAGVTDCVWSTDYEPVEYKKEFLIGEEAVVQSVSVTYDNMLFQGATMLVDKYALYKFRTPWYPGQTGNFSPDYSKPTGMQYTIFQINFNSKYGQEAVPILSIEREDVSFPAGRDPQVINISAQQAKNGPSATFPNASLAGISVIPAVQSTRENKMPGQPTIPFINNTDIQQGRTIKEQCWINTVQTFDNGTWEVHPTIEMESDNRSQVHYNQFKDHRVDEKIIGEEACYPIVVTAPSIGFPVGGAPIGIQDGLLPVIPEIGQPGAHPFDRQWALFYYPDDWNEFALKFRNTSTTTGVYISVQRYTRYGPFAGTTSTQVGDVMKWDNLTDPNWIFIGVDTAAGFSSVFNTPAKRIAFMNFISSFTQGQVFDHDKKYPITAAPCKIYGYEGQIPSLTGFHTVPAFIGTTKVILNYTAHTSMYLPDPNIDMCTFTLIPDVTAGSGYEVTLTKEQEKKYRDILDPVVIPLEPNDPKTVSVRISPSIARINGFSVSYVGQFHRPTYAPHNGPVDMETTAVPGAYVERDIIT